MDESDFIPKTPTKQEFQRIEKIKTASELYIYNRTRARESDDEYIAYNFLVESISIAIAMLGDKYPDETREANQILQDKENYPDRQNLNYLDSRGVYSCSVGEESVGHIVCRPEELDIAQRRLRVQQANAIIRRLKPFDNKLFAILLREGLIKKQELTDAFEKDLIRNFEKDLK